MRARKPLAEEEHRRPGHQAGGKVEAPTHPARILPEHPVGGIGEIELVEEVGRPRPRLAAAQPVAIYYHFAAKEDILVALHLRLHELARPVLGQLAPEAGPSGWAAVLRGLADTMLANRKLFILHRRNQTALSGLHIRDTTATTRTWNSSSARSWATPRSPPATGSG